MTIATSTMTSRKRFISTASSCGGCEPCGSLSRCDAVASERAGRDRADTAVTVPQSCTALVMLVPSNPLDIVPRRGLVAAVALVHLYRTAALAALLIVQAGDLL